MPPLPRLARRLSGCYPSWRLAALLTVLFAAGGLLPSGRFFAAPASYLPLHTLLEFVAMLVAVMVSTLAWSLRRETDNRPRLLLGAGFLAAGLLDFGHVLSYAGMPPLVTASGPEKAINFWLMARAASALALLAVALKPGGHWSGRRAGAAYLAAGACALLCGAAVLYHPYLFPRTFEAGQGLTPFKIFAEYAISGVYGLAAWLFARRALARHDTLSAAFAAAAWIFALAELFFTLYSDVTDLFNLLGHLYKVAASVLVYRAVFVSGVLYPYRALAFERGRFRALFDTIPDPVWLKAPDGRYLACNAAFERLYGWSEAKIKGQTDYDFVDAAQADAFTAYDRRAAAAGQPLLNEEWLTFAADGYRGLFETTKTPMRDMDGGLLGILGIAHDVSARKRAEEGLRESEQHYRTLADSGSALIWTSGADTGFDFVNARWRVFTGQSLQMAAGEGWLAAVHPEDRDAALAGYRAAFAARKRLFTQLRLLPAQGEARWFSVDASPRYSRHGDFLGYIAYCLDISEQKAAEAEIEQLAYYDALTGLPNRRLLADRLERALLGSVRRGSQAALLMIDLDNFKALNDTQGHAAGDRLLAQVGLRLLASVRANDTVARLGGDEFVVIAEDLGQGDAAWQAAGCIAGKLVSALAAPFELEGSDAGAKPCEYRCSASIGVVLTDAPLSVDELMKRADAAMYRAKSGGRNRYALFDPDMLAALVRRTALESALRKAVDEARITCHLQAQVGAAGRVVGAEVLARWHDEAFGTVPPGEFIPLAEACGLIETLGDQVLSLACDRLRAWENEPVLGRLPLSVNVSARQFEQEGFAARVLALAAGVEARLVIELTESVLIDEPQRVIECMQALAAHGVRFSLDDFGTGYSSLAYLKRLPLSELKIDQAFVRDIHRDGNGAAIARTVLALGESLGLAVLAEGVENAEEYHALAQAGCTLFQGYWFGRPEAPDAFEARVREAAAMPA
ncbi:bifunctional diguanylate cyclase/phosphodiesterase [Crenobacter caeni]|uniref:EAL domain-containing protein n=1 Tax=Crenobacter caeni TaxID=2705474 RepID=A0A6B2KRA6_9NEIS|nr:EAL domain-containing protein [Crenobacter caeni]NDV12670.1 EAL domain-containing protein [Crenobacter caeni]